MKKPKIFNKCFWIGHNSSGPYDSTKRDRVCSFCGTASYYDEEAGQKILQVLKIIAMGILIICAFIVLLLTICGIGALVAWPFQLESCKEFAQANNLKYMYKFISGCYVNYNGHWVSPEAIIQLFK